MEVCVFGSYSIQVHFRQILNIALLYCRQLRLIVAFPENEALPFFKKGLKLAKIKNGGSYQMGVAVK